MNSILKQDIHEFVDSFENELGNILAGTSFLVTGATGLIGSTIVKCLLGLNKGIKITCPVRNVEKANSLYGDDNSDLTIIETEITKYTESINEEFRYIVHCASPTDGKYMVKYPVETYELAIDTTRNLLKYAKKSKDCTMVYVSSLEIYGQILEDIPITEDTQGYIDMNSPRSSYPLGKRGAEYLCKMYAMEYNVKVKIARLTQTLGAGISIHDNRVFAQFAKSIMSNNDIVIHTDGLSAKPYIYTTDCVSAILHILLRGKAGESYNVANEDTYISIKDLAVFLRNSFNPNANIVKEKHSENGYAPVTKLRLSTKKLNDLGWKPKYGLKEIYERLINSMKE